MQPSGVRFSPEKRRELAIKAWQIANSEQFPSRHQMLEAVAADLDVAISTARNMVAYGRRIAENRD